MSATQPPRGGRGVRAPHVIMDEARHLHHVHYSLGARDIEWGTPAPRSAQLAHRAVRHARAIQHRQFELATVIREQPGRQIVRDGMADVLHWLKECSCFDADPQRCPWLVQREQEIVEQISAAAAIATAHVNEMFQRLKASVEAAAPAIRRITAALGMGIEGLSQDDYALAPPPHRTGRAAQRSPYGPQKGR